jgi:RNA polymerase sigma factor (TIGR02999 family)
VTLLLRRLRSGAEDAEPRLIELIYEELRRRASALMLGERQSHTLTPTALVHEAYLRLISAYEHTFESRTHFFAVAATAMRRVLVDHARARNAGKRGPGGKVPLDELQIASPVKDEQMLALDEALTRLAKFSPRQSRVVELRYFAGLTETEVAGLLGVSRKTVNRDWELARSWLFGQIKDRRDDR